MSNDDVARSLPKLTVFENPSAMYRKSRLGTGG